MGDRLENIYYASPVWLQNLLVSAHGYRLYRQRYSGRFKEIRSLLAESRSWTESQRLDYQNEKLHEMVRFCRHNVPYYQKLFSEHGISEQDITHVNDLHKIPILEKDTLRHNADAFRALGARPYILQNTSGSTGTPLTLSVDETTYKMAMALVVDHEEYHGIPFGARRATFAGRMVQKASDLSPPFWRFNRAENQRLYSSYHLNKDSFPAYQRDLNAFAPLELIGYPSAIADIAGYFESADARPRFQPKAIITNSETLLAWQRDRIERVFQCPVRDYYGSAEYVVFAAQDENGLYQINPTLGVTEVLTGGNKALQGDIIATTLTNRCMPLLRYRLGDSAELAPDSHSSTAQTVIGRVTGRIDDYLETPDGRKIGRIDHIFKGLSGIKEAQVIQTDMNRCVVKVVAQEKEFSQITKEITMNLKKRTFSGMNVEVEFVRQIPKGPNGKFRSVMRVKDER